MILLELTFITGRPKETRLALLKSLNEKVVATGIFPSDLVIMLHEIAGENASFGSGWRSEPTSRLKADLAVSFTGPRKLSSDRSPKFSDGFGSTPVVRLSAGKDRIGST
jgi:hypothetical protein